MIKRCFAFGCSFTHWFYWPTWADFIGINYDQFYNLGMPGSSNQMVHNRLIEANAFYKFNENDLVLVGVTNFGRLNWLEEIDNKLSWCCHGGPQNWPDNEKTKFLKNHFWKQNYGIYDTWLMVINSTQLFRATNVNFKFIMSMDNSHFMSNEILQLADREIEMSSEIYKNCVSQQSLQEFSKDTNHHPTAIEHFDYAKKYFPELLTEKSSIFMKEISNSINFNCCDEESKIYGQIRARYLNDLAPIDFPMYGKYH